MPDITARGPRSAGIRNAANAANARNRQEVQIIGVSSGGDQSTTVFPSNRTHSHSPFYFTADTADACYFNANIGELGFVVRGNPPVISGFKLLASQQWEQQILRVQVFIPCWHQWHLM